MRYRVRVRFSGNRCLTFEIIPIFFDVLGAVQLLRNALGGKGEAMV